SGSAVVISGDVLLVVTPLECATLENTLRVAHHVSWITKWHIFVIPECIYRESISARNSSRVFVISNNDFEQARNRTPFADYTKVYLIQLESNSTQISRNPFISLLCLCFHPPLGKGGKFRTREELLGMTN